MIPRTIHQVWVGSPIPPLLAMFAETWRGFHPTWTYRLWTEDDAHGLVNQRLYNRATEIASGSEGQLRSDILRYEILARHGGVYVDFDMECLRPIDELIDVPAFVGWEEPGRWINNAIMGSIPGHPFVVACVHGLARSVKKHKGHRPNTISGPQYATPLLTPGVVVYPKAHFYPYLWNELHRAFENFPDSYAVHHWNNSRKRRGVPYEGAAT